MTPSKPPTPSMAEEITLGEFLGVLWSGRYVILATAGLAVILGYFYAWRTTPIFQVQALLQVGPKQTGKGGSALEAKVESISDMSSQAQGEIEIIQSNQILGRAVTALKLNTVVEPKTSLLFGTALVRRQKPAPLLVVETLDVPEAALGEEFIVEVKGPGQFLWKDPDGKPLAQGKVGDTLDATWQGHALRLKVSGLAGRNGQRFIVYQAPLLEAIDEVRSHLSIAEKGKETNILELSYLYPNPQRGADILNAILDQYNRQNLERKTQEAGRTLAMLQDEIAQIKEKQSQAEHQLSETQSGAGSPDPGEEAKLVLQRSLEVDKEILALQQRKAELLRTYRENSDVVTTVNQQIAKFQEVRKQLEAKVRAIPGTQREVQRRTQQVQTNQERVSSLMKLEALNFQQLQMARAGEIGTAYIVDRAIPGSAPVKPRKSMILAVSFIMGTVAGMAFLIIRRALHRGRVENPLVLEAQFGLPVLSTIPHSPNQDNLSKQARKTGKQEDLLSNLFPSDLAVESLRSLRTSLHFTLVDAPSRAIMIAGASPEIGKSFVSANFAMVLAQFGAKVLLVDADMRKGKLHRMFGAATRKDGLSEILIGNMDWHKGIHRALGLDMISTGTLPPNPSKLLVGERFGTFIAEACKEYDYVIVDAPPILAVTDAAIIGAQMGAVLLLVKDGQHPLGEIRAALQNFQVAGVQPKGFVFNDINPNLDRVGFNRHTYYYTYQN